MPSFWARQGDDSVCGPVPQPRRNAPLPPLDGPRGLQHAAVAAATARSAANHFDGAGSSSSAYPASSPLSSVRSSRVSAGSSIGPMDLQAGGPDQWSCSRSTSASSYQGGGRPAPPQVPGSPHSVPDSSQAELVVKAMLPVVKRGMASPNRSVFQTSLDSMTRIQRMFGKKAIDEHLDELAEALQKQCTQPGGDARAVTVLKTLLTLCSDEGATKLCGRFPSHAAEAQGN